MSRRVVQRFYLRLLWSVVLIGLFIPGRVAGEEGEVWDPARTWVFAVSSMEWKFDPEANFPKEGRQDVVLIDTFKARGVADDHIVFLKDKQGTLAHIRKSFRNLLSRTGEGDLLIFYFQGHGSRDIDGKKSRYYFVNYDANDEDDDTFLYVREVYDTIEAHFKGSRVLMTADCCCSGGIMTEAAKRKSPLAYACLASVFAHNGSTGDWTYTRSLIKGFRGNPMVDLDGDGVVTLDELNRFTVAQMAYIEEQKAVYRVPRGIDRNLQIATAKKKVHPDVGKYVEVNQDDEWFVSQVEGFKDGKFHIHYLGYKEREWVTPDRIREFRPKRIKVGTKVNVVDEEGKVHPATVKRAAHGLHLVHFDDDDSPNGVADEWVPPARIQDRPSE